MKNNVFVFKIKEEDLNMNPRSKKLVLAAQRVSTFSLLHIIYVYNNVCHQLMVIIKCFVIVSNYCTFTI